MCLHASRCKVRVEVVNLGWHENVFTDPVVHEAARVLTAMYVHDVASLQRAINGMMESLQELTARPWAGPDRGTRPR